jgi:hypothetical protein
MLEFPWSSLTAASDVVVRNVLKFKALLRREPPATSKEASPVRQSLATSLQGLVDVLGNLNTAITLHQEVVGTLAAPDRETLEVLNDLIGEAEKVTTTIQAFCDFVTGNGSDVVKSNICVPAVMQLLTLSQELERRMQ